MKKELQDKAWAVLPKEVREEVKKMYDAVSAWEKTAEVLGTLFGKHNLFSDTETEEMLIISRKAAEEFYDKYFGERLCEVNMSNLRKDIIILFGGKCRVGEDNIGLNKTKPKFKVGDIVTVPYWTVCNIKPSYIELCKKTCVGITHVITVNEKDILSFGYQPQELHVGDKVDITGWKVIRYRNGTLILKREMAYGFHVINLEESDLKRDTFTLLESGKNTIDIKGYDNNMNRLQVATAAMQGLLTATSGEKITLRVKSLAIAKEAVTYADALLAEINGKGGGDERK